jgi:hypothetical protein
MRARRDEKARVTAFRTEERTRRPHVTVLAEQHVHGVSIRPGVASPRWLESPLPGVQLLNWKAFDRAVETGYHYMLRRIEELRALGPIAGQTPAVAR